MARYFSKGGSDFATQRDVSRRKRDIRTIVLKVRLDNSKGAFVPGMTLKCGLSIANEGREYPQSAQAAGQQ